MTEATLDTPKQYLTLAEAQERLTARGIGHAVKGSEILVDDRGTPVRLLPRYTDPVPLYQACALSYLMEAR